MCCSHLQSYWVFIINRQFGLIWVSSFHTLNIIRWAESSHLHIEYWRVSFMPNQRTGTEDTYYVVGFHFQSLVSTLHAELRIFFISHWSSLCCDRWTEIRMEDVMTTIDISTFTEPKGFRIRLKGRRRNAYLLF